MRLNLKEKQNQKNEVFSFFLFYLMITCCIYIMPFFKFVVPYIVAAPLMLAILFPFFFKKTPWLTRVIMMCAVFLAVALIGALNGVYSFVGAINEFVRNVRFFLPIFIGCYALKFTTKKQQTFFLFLFGVLVVSILLKTLIELEKDPWISRILAQGSDHTSSEINQFRIENVGGFEFSYMMAVITFCLTWLALKTKKILTRVLAITAVVVCFYYIIETMYTTLLLLTFIGVVALIFFSVKNKTAKFFLVIGAIAISFLMTPIFEILSSAFPEDSLLNSKFDMIYRALTEKDISNLGSRPALIAESFENWLKAPILGDNYDNLTSHSLIMNILQFSGVVGFIPWVAMFFVGYKMLLKEFKEKAIENDLLIVSFLYVFVLSFFNPIGYVFEVTIAAFCIVPMWSNLISKKKECELE